MTVIFLMAFLMLGPSSRLSQPVTKDVSITSSDGFVLAGRYYSAGTTGPGLLLLHQCNREGPLTGYEKLAALLAERGFNVLELDFRGFGGSRNEQYSNWHTQMNETEPKFPADVEAAYQYLVAQHEVNGDLIGVVGASCGATQAIFLAQKHESIKALVFLSGSMWPGARTAFDDIRDIPLLIATSENDRVTLRMQELFAESVAASSRLLIYKGELHGAPLFNLDGSLESTIAEWFQTALINKLEIKP